MPLKLKAKSQNINAELKLPGSKSESNRLLILQAFFSNLKIGNCSDSNDSQVLKKALASNKKTIDIGHAGTAMRFLTAYFAIQKGEKILTGSERMQNRPIKILVNALRDLGAEINYQNKEGFPPILIKGQKIKKNTIELNADVSSQYISALLLIAPILPNGLNIKLRGEILSRPYIDMTLDLLKKLDIQTSFQDDVIKVFPKKSISEETISVESDWSAASYLFSLAALADSAEIRLSTFKKNSLQGDAVVAKIYEQFGVETVYETNTIWLKKCDNVLLPKKFEMDLTNYPDLAQTLAVTCLGLQISCKLTGLQSLKIKETDRLKALKTELSKFGAQVEIDADSLQLYPSKKFKSNVLVKTYNDHRMAMAFAPLALKIPLSIENPKVVSKSFPGFWEALEACGFLFG